MKAYVVETVDGTFRAVDTPTPLPAQDQVLVKIHASGINPLDTKIRAGQGGHAKQPLPAILGLDMAGIVESVGPASPHSHPATKSMAWSAVSQACKAPSPNTSRPTYPSWRTNPKRSRMRQAAALPLVTITAWEGLVDRANVRAKQTVLDPRRCRWRRLCRNANCSRTRRKSLHDCLRRQARDRRGTRRNRHRPEHTCR